MAKAKKATARARSAPKKNAARKQSRREAARILDDGPIRRKAKPRPKTQPLPGLEDIAASKSLDKVCSSLKDVRDQKNDLAQQEAGLLGEALRVMRTESRFMYRGHGIELVRKAGDEKVQARLTKAQGTIEAPESDSDDVDDDLDNGADDVGGGVEADAPF